MKNIPILPFSLLLVALLLMGCDFYSPSQEPSPSENALTLTLHADKTSVMVGEQVSFTGTLRNTAGYEEKLYCAKGVWNFGDGETLVWMPDCPPYTSGAKIQTTFQTTNAYKKPGVFIATFKVGDFTSQSLRITVEDVKKKDQNPGTTIIWKSDPAGDLVPDTRDPKAVCLALQIEKKLDLCTLFESLRLDYGGERCVDGAPAGGCFACKFECTK